MTLTIRQTTLLASGESVETSAAVSLEDHGDHIPGLETIDVARLAYFLTGGLMAGMKQQPFFAQIK